MKHIILAAAFIFLAALARMIVRSGLSNNTIFLFLLTAAFFIYRIFYEKFIAMRWLNILIAAAVLIFMVFAVFLAVYGANDTVSYGEDVLVVLGCGLNGDEVSQTLKRRLDAAAGYHEKNPAALIIVSGGQGPGEKITEAEAMEKYLIEKGVPAKKIFKEPQALSTYENIFYSKKIIDDNFETPPSVALVTSDFHIYRGDRFAKGAGLNVTHLHSSSSWYAVPVNYARECAAVIKMWLIKK